MPKPASRFIATLTDDELDELEFFMNHGDTPRVRHRAHAILLSYDGKSINEIADIFWVDRDTVINWLDLWEELGVDGLSDKVRPGASPKLSGVEQQLALKILGEHPHNPKRVLEELETQTDKEISISTLKRLARTSGLRWKRMRRSTKSRRDEEAFREAQIDLAEFQELHRQGHIDLCYFDQSGFSLIPNVPYGWQRIGTTIEIPSRHSRRINVAGIMSYGGRKLFPYSFECKLDSQCVISCIDDFAKSLTRLTILVLDNASVHSSHLFFDQLPRWEKRGLLLYFLPPYCPELNLIEILWRRIKYSWLPLSAYQSFEKLREELWNVLTSISAEGTLQLNFA